MLNDGGPLKITFSSSEIVGVSGCQWESVGVSGSQWESVGVSGSILGVALNFGATSSIFLENSYLFKMFK